jgi:hypothetical protein
MAHLSFVLLVSFGSPLFDGTFVFCVVGVLRITNNTKNPENSGVDKMRMFVQDELFFRRRVIGFASSQHEQPFFETGCFCFSFLKSVGLVLFFIGWVGWFFIGWIC